LKTTYGPFSNLFLNLKEPLVFVQGIFLIS
jgi:hypothetical protein